ncbi:MAG: hypothetical protein CVU55_03875 [Deltaproteobacteria bacterium HGW-Deltaproteobacteria-13]|nr:MAG: hypothetical protein CVU55_03875 [Deltaproteobacteria bacterium HGW-Deltaproteobacteria-13]
MKISKSGIIVAAITIIIGLFFLFATWEAYSEYMRVNKYAGYAIGHVTKKNFSQAADGNGIYYIDYWFLIPGGNRISSTGNILQQQWDTLKIDDTLEIRYDLSSPDRNIPKYGGSLSLVYVFLVFILGAVFLIFGLMRLMNSFNMRNSKAA